MGDIRSGEALFACVLTSLSGDTTLRLNCGDLLTCFMVGLEGGGGRDMRPGFLGGKAGFGFFVSGGGFSLGVVPSELERGFESLEDGGLSRKLSVLFETVIGCWAISALSR